MNHQRDESPKGKLQDLLTEDIIVHESAQRPMTSMKRNEKQLNFDLQVKQSYWNPNNVQRKDSQKDLEEYKKIRDKVVSSSASKFPYNFIADKSIMNQLKREFFKSNSIFQNNS